MSRFAWIAVLSLFCFQAISAREATKTSTKELVAEYYLSKSYEQISSGPLKDCDVPKKSSCIQVACSKMPDYHCDNKSEIKDIAMACSNVDGGCIESVCNKMSNYYCDDPSEIKEIAVACRGLLDSECIDVVCSKLGSYDCDQFSELKEIIEMCKNP